MSSDQLVELMRNETRGAIIAAQSMLGLDREAAKRLTRVEISDLTGLAVRSMVGRFGFYVIAPGFPFTLFEIDGVRHYVVGQLDRSYRIIAPGVGTRGGMDARIIEGPSQ